MFSIACLLFTLGFITLMNTSRRISWSDRPPVMAFLYRYPLYSYCLSAGMFGTAAMLCIHIAGAMSGIFAAVVMLMATGSVCVLFFPFRYTGIVRITVLFVISLLLELLL